MGSVNDINDAELVKRAVANCMSPRSTSWPLWETVSRRFSLGSTYSAQLCRRFGFNPEGPGKR